jgi:hypothetical protein
LMSLTQLPDCAKASTPGVSNVVASSTICQRDVLDRPTIGAINFCPSAFDVTAPNVAYVISVALHEALHILGFSYDNFALFRHPDGSPRTARDSTGFPPLSLAELRFEADENTLRNDFSRGRRRRAVVTPSVVETVRALFGCSLLNGAELEDGGDVGTRLNHWERRLFGVAFISKELTPTERNHDRCCAALQPPVVEADAGAATRQRLVRRSLRAG